MHSKRYVTYGLTFKHDEDTTPEQIIQTMDVVFTSNIKDNIIIDCELDEIEEALDFDDEDYIGEEEYNE